MLHSIERNETLDELEVVNKQLTEKVKKYEQELAVAANEIEGKLHIFIEKADIVAFKFQKGVRFFNSWK